jgi:hypothetical protein
VAEPAEAEKILDSIPVRYVVIDRFSGTPSRPYVELVRRMIALRPDVWRLTDTQGANAPTGKSGEIEVYQRFGSMPDQVHVWVNLNRMIGRVIGK